VQLAECLVLEALALHRQDLLGRAESVAREAAELSAEILRSSPDHVRTAELSARAYVALGDILRSTARTNEAAATFALALATVNALADGQAGLGSAHVRAEALLRLDRENEAAPILRQLEESGYRRHRSSVGTAHLKPNVAKEKR
jgi:hypothetical protein